MSPLNRVRKLFSRNPASATTAGQATPIAPVTVVHADPKLHYCPYGPGFPEGRVDAGLDQSHSFVGPLYAVGAGTVTKIDPVGSHSWGGGGSIWYEIDHPIAVKDEHGAGTYKLCYAAEMGYINPRLKVGSRVAPGKLLGRTKSGWSECGFYGGQDMSGQLPTVPGYHWRAFYHWTLEHPYQKPGAKPKPQPKPSGTQVPHQ